ARLRLDRHVARLLPHPDCPDRALLAAGLGQPLGLRHDVARPAVDPVQLDAGRPRGPLPAVHRRSLLPRQRPRAALRNRAMSPTTQGAIVLVTTLIVLLCGAPVAFGLGALSIVFLLIFQGFGSLQVVAETFYAGLNDFTLVSIPMFVMMGAAIGSSPAGRDLYEALDRWLYRLPGGLVISNLGACAIFAVLTGLFMLWTLFAIWRRGFRAHAPEFRYSWKEKFQSVPKVAPFLAIIVGVMYVLYGGVATPSEAAGVGAALCVVLAVLIYRMWQPREWWQILRDTTRESVMILTIIGAAVLFGYMLTSLYLTQTLAQAIADMHVNRWVLMALINLFLLVCGFFIPPAAIILMTSPILLPIIRAAGFDPVWFGVIMTINMEIGLIHPPVGLN